MKNKILILALISSLIFACDSSPTMKYRSFFDYPVYDGPDLGLTYSPQRSTFKVWSPIAQQMKLRFYHEGIGGKAVQEYELEKDKHGVWEITLEEELKGLFYTFQAYVSGLWLNEVPDPYAKAVGVNGQRAQVIDLAETNPKNWDKDSLPAFNHKTDAILYELHIRDLSIHPASGIQHKGKFLGLTETDTKTPNGISTGLDHIKSLGVTHVHLLPSFDFRSIDETKLEENDYNWGYDPENYNVPEGSYSTDPYDGATRIKEFKQMVQALHKNGLRVVMDVVYNHTGATKESLFNQLVPGYYYRQKWGGEFSDASACGNETASERHMMRKFIVESLKYWVTEYHIDGFRFDLMGIHDIETMNLISKELHQIKPDILLYGEGWTVGSSPLPGKKRALKRYTHKLEKIAAFSDDFRDGVKGSVFNAEDTGFITGKEATQESIKFGIVASTEHPQVDYPNVNYSNAPWANEPYQSIQYVSCHDNHTLFDKLTLSAPKASEEELINRQKLAGAMVLTAQGIPFLHAGMEFLRTKQGEENSYESPDSINQLDWLRKEQYMEVVNYFQDLIQLRKDYLHFRLSSTKAIQENLQFLEQEDEFLIAYIISGEKEELLIIYNANPETRALDLPEGEWRQLLSPDGYSQSGKDLGNPSELVVGGMTAVVLVNEKE